MTVLPAPPLEGLPPGAERFGAVEVRLHVEERGTDSMEGPACLSESCQRRLLLKAQLR